MIPETFRGIPLHPLVVHGAVVLVPLAALGLLVIPWRAAWRRAYGIPVAAIAVAGSGFSLLATQSGKSFEEASEAAGHRLGEHPELGDTAMLFALGLGIVAVALVAYDRFGSRFKIESTAYARGLALICGVAAVAAVATMYQAGHSGAEVAWGSTQQAPDSSEGDEATTPASGQQGTPTNSPDDEGDEGDEGRVLPARASTSPLAAKSPSERRTQTGKFG